MSKFQVQVTTVAAAAAACTAWPSSPPDIKRGPIIACIRQWGSLYAAVWQLWRRQDVKATAGDGFAMRGTDGGGEAPNTGYVITVNQKQ